MSDSEEEILLRKPRRALTDSSSEEQDLEDDCKVQSHEAVAHVPQTDVNTEHVSDSLAGDIRISSNTILDNIKVSIGTLFILLLIQK